MLFTSNLPEAFDPDIFWTGIPKWIAFGENTFRILIMSIPAIMVFSLKTKKQKVGFGIYLMGTLLYFGSWVVLIMEPNGGWGQSLTGFMAPAYTPLLWLIGIGLIGDRSFFKINKLTFIYISLSVLFIVFHLLHTYTVYQRL